MALMNATDILSASAGISMGSIPSSLGLWSWAGLSTLALMASIAILAFMYIWATLFRNPQMNAYVKQEILECFITAILIVIIFGVVGSLHTMMLGSFVPDSLLPEGVDSSTTVYDATQKFYEQVDDDMSTWLNLNYIMNTKIDQIASITPYARPLGVGLVASPLTGIASPLKQLVYNMSTAVTMAFIINHAQLVVYLFSLYAFLNFYLPLGIFLRSFSPTRRLGGTLIAIALVFLFIFPALATITYSMFYSKSSGPLVSFGSMLADYFNDTTSGGFQYYFENFFHGLSQSTDIMDLIAGVFGGIGDLIQTLVGTAFLFAFLIPTGIISFAFVLGFVIPAVNIIIFTAAAKSMSKAFGEEADISALTRMI